MKGLVLSLLVALAYAAPRTKPKFRPGLINRVGIVGGDEVAPGELPYQLSYQDLTWGTTRHHYCGASIYNENWAICAGHCVDGEDFDNPGHLRIVAGEHNMTVPEGHEQVINITKIIRHEDFNLYSFSNDISLLKLEVPLVFNDYVQPIALPEPGVEPSGNCTVSGWGALHEHGVESNVLMKATVPIVTDEVCREIHGYWEIEESMVCAGYENGGKDACQGDSGGPLVCYDTGAPYLAGIVSWGIGCGRWDYYGVYAEVSFFVDWIKEHTS